MSKIPVYFLTNETARSENANVTSVFGELVRLRINIRVRFVGLFSCESDLFSCKLLPHCLFLTENSAWLGSPCSHWLVSQRSLRPFFVLVMHWLYTFAYINTCYLACCRIFSHIKIFNVSVNTLREFASVSIRDAILTCARKPTWVNLIYRSV